MYEEEERADFYARTAAAAKLLRLVVENYEEALNCPDYQEARCVVDRAMDVLQYFVRQSRPPGPRPV